MFKREIWDKFTDFTFWNFDFKISKNERGKFSPNFTNIVTFCNYYYNNN